MGKITMEQYAIFKTQWGWFGLSGDERGLVRTYLPAGCKEAVKSRLLADSPGASPSKNAFSGLKTAIVDYYRGAPVDFSGIKIQLEGVSEFQRRVLTNLRRISYGETISYGQLARRVGSPKAARAIGTVMAANPLPLIIPCHRVIKANGAPGQFSAPGGASTKKRMLNLEKTGYPPSTY